VDTVAIISLIVSVVFPIIFAEPVALFWDRFLNQTKKKERQGQIDFKRPDFKLSPYKLAATPQPSCGSLS
jgi:hypothetical protein